MANATRDISITKSAYIKEASPTSHYNTDSSTQYRISDDDNSGSYSPNNYLLFGFGSWPASLKRNKLIDVKLRAYVRGGSSFISTYMCEDFNAGSVTYKTRPTINYGFGGNAQAVDLGISVGAWGDVWLPFSSTGYSLATFLNRRAFLLDGPMNVSGNTPWLAKTVLAGGGTPYLRVTYSDSEIEISKVVLVQPLSGSINPRVIHNQTWKLSPTYGYICVDNEFTQASATFFWRVQGSGSYTAINAVGSNMIVSIPAFTFPTGQTIEYYVQVTDTDGNTSNSGVRTFTTPASKITPQDSPTSGYRNPREDITFSWYFANTAGDYEQSSASLYWRETGSDSWTQVDAAGSAKSLTIPANTFPAASSVDWYLSGVDSSGSASTTEVYTFSTTAATAYATAVSPSGNVEDGSAPITFRWTLESADGLEMSRIDLWWKLPSEASNQWHVIKSSTEIITEWTVPAGYFQAGEIEWLVHAFNIDGTRGPDSITSFICVAAPDPVRGLAATPVPMTTIRWQSEGQEAYEISIDGEVVKKAYGVGVYSWKVEEPLADGEHVISVRIQGIYGLWSQPSVTTVFIENVPEMNVELVGEFGIDADLTLNIRGSQDEPDAIQWYRDGKRIAKTSGTLKFKDRFALGNHVYFAEIWHDSGNYTRSNMVEGTMQTSGKLIALYSGGEWMDISLSESSTDEQSFGWTKENALLHVTGARLPILEESDFEDRIAKYNCAFREVEKAEEFKRKFKGKMVVIKSRRGNILVGAMTSLDEKVLRHYTAFSFTIQENDWEDFVEYEETD